MVEGVAWGLPLEIVFNDFSAQMIPDCVSYCSKANGNLIVTRADGSKIHFVPDQWVDVRWGDSLNRSDNESDDDR
jgi:hypothetical protein